jgi:hypothetical protein
MTETATVLVQTRTCLVCGKNGVVEMPAEAYHEWTKGAFIQTAWPEGTPGQREHLISGTHPDCWDKMWGDAE